MHEQIVRGTTRAPQANAGRMRAFMTFVRVVGILGGLSSIALAYSQDPTSTVVDVAVLKTEMTAMKLRMDRIETLGTGIILAVVSNLVISGLSLKKSK